jgi:hypothetical protein
VEVNVKGIAALCAAAVVGAACFQDGSESRGKPTLEERVSALERWKEKIDARIPIGPTSPAENPQQRRDSDEKRGPIDLKVTGKRVIPKDARRGRFSEYIVWDAEFTYSRVSKDVRAAKGAIEFRDIFGELKIAVATTLNKPAPVGGTVRESEQGIERNQFIDRHDWLAFTSLDDMVVRFRVEELIYSDGTRESF